MKCLQVPASHKSTNKFTAMQFELDSMSFINEYSHADFDAPNFLLPGLPLSVTSSIVVTDTASEIDSSQVGRRALRKERKRNSRPVCLKSLPRQYGRVRNTAYESE
jgi:hypothetical protein